MKSKPLALLVLAALFLGAIAALQEWAQDVDGIRSEGVPVSCWHWRPSERVAGGEP